MIPDYVSLPYRVTYWHHPGKINWCQTWPGNTRGARFSQFALCIQRYVQGYRSFSDIFTHVTLEKYFGATWWPCYNGVCV